MPGLGWGADYNPEQWPEHVWAEDVELMRAAGVNLVSVGIFSWARIEVAKSEYRFDWLDRIMDMLHAGGIRVDLATATASPPPWLTAEYPEMLPVRADGVRLSHGSRQAYCPTSPIYRERATALAAELASHYRDHPALAAWHVGNEYGCHVQRCYCDTCAAAFRDWLAERYTLDEVNDAWSTAFWSQGYTRWEQILPPRVTPTFSNPGQVLDYDRFASDALLELYKAERDVLRMITPDVPVTTNFMVNWTFAALDYWKWAREVDFVSNDHYTQSESPDRHVELALSADLVRGLAGGHPWLLMEHSTSAVNWQPRNIAKLPGEMRRHSFAHIARGADGTLFFQWRQSRGGSERFHSAMVPHAGTETKVFREVSQVGAEYQLAAEVVGSTVDASVAVVYDYDSRWAARQPSHPTADFDYQRTVLDLYRALWELGVTVDFVPPGADLSSYRLVVVPSLYAVRDADAAVVTDYVSGGGHALVTYLSGVADEHARIRLGGYPGAFREMLGVWTEEFFPLRQGETVSLDDESTVSVWTEHLHARGASVVASYLDGPLPGVPAVTRNEHGAGVAWYLACGLTGEGLTRTVEEALRGASVPVSRAGLEIVRRSSAGADGHVSWLFAVNHTDTDAELDASGVELLSGTRVSGRLTVRAGDVVVLREEV
ncbi:beta-galactosidase [Lentzea tibetensis]|uniref:Beta-galactosidase n=2 Tax=Lentzea tibetensis TaxID=2591470 RepID=A0A563EQU5_9PSEU|nr:beta-galactosidase [Lentzea tibetensis]